MFGFSIHTVGVTGVYCGRLENLQTLEVASIESVDDGIVSTIVRGCKCATLIGCVVFVGVTSLCALQEASTVRL